MHEELENFETNLVWMLVEPSRDVNVIGIKWVFKNKQGRMSMMGELTFFLGIQVKKTKQGTFVHQAKYMNDLMKKFNMAELKPVSTPMTTTMSLDPDENGEAADQREYRSMTDSLLYLTVTRPDIQFAMCLYAHFQASPRSSHQTTI
jgi:hypothetical protein